MLTLNIWDLTLYTCIFLYFYIDLMAPSVQFALSLDLYENHGLFTVYALQSIYML